MITPKSQTQKLLQQQQQDLMVGSLGVSAKASGTSSLLNFLES
jgi:hypothetical protein